MAEENSLNRDFMISSYHHDEGIIEQRVLGRSEIVVTWIERRDGNTSELHKAIAGYNANLVGFVCLEQHLKFPRTLKYELVVISEIIIINFAGIVINDLSLPRHRAYSYSPEVQCQQCKYKTIGRGNIWFFLPERRTKIAQSERLIVAGRTIV